MDEIGALYDQLGSFNKSLELRFAELGRRCMKNDREGIDVMKECVRIIERDIDELVEKIDYAEKKRRAKYKATQQI